MRNLAAIENIEELRRQEGIDDIELREEIRRLKVGDFVNLTLLVGASSSRNLLVRITRIRGIAFLGDLVNWQAASPLPELEAGAPLAFTAAHIHSIAKGQPAQMVARRASQG